MKKITTFLIVMIISCSCLQVSANNDVLEAKKANFNIVLHGRQEKFNLPIATINDNTYVPLRELCEKLNMNLYWDAHDKEIGIYKKTPLAPISTNEPQSTQNPYKPNTERTAYTLKDFSFLTIDMSINDIMERMGEPSYWAVQEHRGQYMYYQMVVNYHWLCIDIMLKQGKNQEIQE